MWTFSHIWLHFLFHLVYVTLLPLDFISTFSLLIQLFTSTLFFSLKLSWSQFTQNCLFLLNDRFYKSDIQRSVCVLLTASIQQYMTSVTHGSFTPNIQSDLVLTAIMNVIYRLNNKINQHKMYLLSYKHIMYIYKYIWCHWITTGKHKKIRDLICYNMEYIY